MAQKGGYISKKKGAKKGLKKKPVDTFAKKEWFDLKTPSIFANTTYGKTLVTRSSAKQNLNKLLYGRCFEANQADLTNNPKENIRKFKFVVDEVRGREAHSSFYGMDLITDKARGIIRKWHTLIEGNIAIRTTDGYTLRVFVMAQSKRPEGYTKARCYIQSTAVKKIRKVMFDVIKEELEDCDINAVMKKLCEENIGKSIDYNSRSIYPLQNCFVKKVSVIKRPKKIVEEVEMPLVEGITNVEVEAGEEVPW
ncbi:ribosomal 40S subunit protein S1B [Conglomerata obtusa]